jgi:hypothetical protein
MGMQKRPNCSRLARADSPGKQRERVGKAEGAGNIQAVREIRHKQYRRDIPV